MTIGRTAIRRHRMFLRDPEEGGGGGGGGGGQGGNSGGNNSGGTENANEFKAVTSQEELDRIVTNRVRRVEAKYADYDTWREKGQQYDALERESLSDKERAIAQAREEALNEAMSKAVPKAVRAEFRAAAKGVLTKEQLDSVLEDLDLTKYADKDGAPDEEKIGKKIAALAPGKNGGGNGGPPPAFGQGTREVSAPKKGDGGLAEAQRRFPEKFAGKS